MGRRIANKVDDIRAGFAKWGESSQQGWTYGLKWAVTTGVRQQGRDGDKR